MNFWLALILSVLVGWLVGRALVKDGKIFSWHAFFIAFFIMLGGLQLVFGLLGLTLEIIVILVRILFWVAVVVAIIYFMVKLIQKAKQQQQPPAEPPAPTQT